MGCIIVGMNRPTRNLTIIALLAAAICVLAPWSLPIGAVPATLATFIIYVTASVAGFKRGTLATVLYICMGTIGLPVFSGFSGGFGYLAGPTGGFIAGYVPCALLTGVIVDARPGSLWSYPTGMAIGTLACYALGTAWFAVSTGNSWGAALAVCVLPFLPVDALKLIAASAVAFPVRKKLAAAKLI